MKAEEIYQSLSKHNKEDHATERSTALVLNQAVADMSKAYSIVHQIHWYMRGAGFLYLHPKMDELMDTLNDNIDVMSERLITIGGAPFSTLKEFDEFSNLEEVKGDYNHTMTERLTRLVEVYQYLSNLCDVGLTITDEENDAVTNDIFTTAQADIQKTIWMFQAELSKAPGIA